MEVYPERMEANPEKLEANQEKRPEHSTVIGPLM
jgi:hypothetical protein